MCGIFGGIGKWNQGTIRALTWANRERGTDSLGFFDSSGKMIKSAADPDVALGQENITRWLNTSEKGGEKRDAAWFCIGHTRLATRGKVNRQNSHPFRYGKIIGCHNGMVDAPKGYVVDSQYLFDSLNKANGDYNKAWADITGYWGVVWFDDDALYIQVHNGEVNIGQTDDGTWYFSSNRIHLLACIGYNTTVQSIKEGETLKFTCVNGVVTMETVEPFVSTAPEYWTRKYGTSNSYTYNYEDDWQGYQTTGGRRHGKGSKGWTNYGDTDKFTRSTTPARDYDSEWRDAWEAYTAQSEHSQVD